MRKASALNYEGAPSLQDDKLTLGCKFLGCAPDSVPAYPVLLCHVCLTRQSVTWLQRAGRHVRSKIISYLLPEQSWRTVIDACSAIFK